MIMNHLHYLKMLNLKLQILKLKKEFAKRNDLTSQY